jgi:RNA polymerase sigma-70 factor, ECF subfamily
VIALFIPGSTELQSIQPKIIWSPGTDVDLGDADLAELPSELIDNGSPEDKLSSNELHLLINNAIEELPEDLRTAFTLREFGGLSYEEITQIMDCPVGTVRSRIFRAREALDAIIDPFIKNGQVVQGESADNKKSDLKKK